MLNLAEQQDPHEAFLFLVKACNDELRERSMRQGWKPIEEIVGFLTRSRKKCPRCGVWQNGGAVDVQGICAHEVLPVACVGSVQVRLDHFLAPDVRQLRELECAPDQPEDRCGLLLLGHEAGGALDVEFRDEMWRRPQVLVVQAMRFSSVGGVGERLFNRFPAESVVRFADRLYGLRSVVAHEGGRSAQEGHYTAFCKASDPDRPWEHWNDTRGTGMTDSEARAIFDINGYLFFYDLQD
jgi:uncharacterized UBP type Zn finger protein